MTPCCDMMREQLEQTCNLHSPENCPDVVVLYSPRNREYTLPVRDGGDSGIIIRYCPWCAAHLAASTPLAAWGAAPGDICPDCPGDDTFDDSHADDCPRLQTCGQTKLLIPITDVHPEPAVWSYDWQLEHERLHHDPVTWKALTKEGP